MRCRKGFTITELLIVLTLIGIVGGFAAINIGKGLAQTRVQRAAAVISTDLKLAHSLAARSRVPVKISIDTAGKVVSVVNYTTWTTVYSSRNFGQNAEIPVEYMSTTDTTLLVLPNGLADREVTITLRAAGERRAVWMSRAGLVRVSAP